MRQRGFTLVELLVTTAVGGIIIMGVMGAFYQIAVGTSRNNSQVVALTDVHRAALQIKQDIQMTQNVDSIGDSDIALSWTDFTSFYEEEDRNHSCSYELLEGDLRRTYDGEISIIGRSITSVNFSQDGRLVSVAITATEGGISERSETLDFSVYMRGGGMEE